VRHSEKWRLALEMIEEMTGPRGWGVLEQITAGGGARPVAVADAGYGDITTFRLELADRGWPYVLAVKGTTSAYAGDAEPVSPARRSGPGRPPKAAYPGPPVNLRQLAIAHADQTRPVTWRHGTRTAPVGRVPGNRSILNKLDTASVCPRGPPAGRLAGGAAGKGG
jgi:hypothetical protein